MPAVETPKTCSPRRAWVGEVDDVEDSGPAKRVIGTARMRGRLGVRDQHTGGGGADPSAGWKAQPTRRTVALDTAAASERVAAERTAVRSDSQRMSMTVPSVHAPSRVE